MSTSRNESTPPAGAQPDWLEIVKGHVESLRYGAVEIVVHDSRVIQIEKIERVRLDKPASETGKPAKTSH